MYLYNTLGQKKTEFVPHDGNKVNMYTCGPTVYHFAHIGNLRTYIMEDVLEKYLRYSGYDVTRVMNITDVGHLTSDADTGDDKMLQGAKREHKTVMEIAKFYTDAFFADCAKLNIKTPDVVEPATNCIDDFINMVSALIDKGYAYLAGGNVYFDTSKLDDYYVFGNMNADDLEVGVREDVTGDDNKRNKTDFVLWFTKSKFEDQALKWESPWGVGYPGWHIECSSISIKHLGEHLDIHCGGVDNAFPHHTNEIAQSEAFLGHKWCNYWFHVLHLNDARGKMSKSKGEFLTVSLLEEKGYNPLVYRMFCLQSHYRKPLTFSYDSLDNTAKAYDKLIKRISSLKADGEVDKDKAKEFDNKFREVLDNDLNTSLGLTAVYDVLKADVNDATKLYLIEKFDEVLSLNLVQAESTEENDLDAEIESLIEKRQEARANKDWATADKIRDDLLARNIKLIDTPDGVKWELIN
ncbi:MAG: cysteine--tRNA ligase [Ruminococcus sp.]|nr:cysteine--tRNA ligase [Ruminococcus sp.]